MNQDLYDLLVVGAGPAGLATAIEEQRQGLRVVVIDRRGVVEHIWPLKHRHALSRIGG